MANHLKDDEHLEVLVPHDAIDSFAEDRDVHVSETTLPITTESEHTAVLDLALAHPFEPGAASSTVSLTNTNARLSLPSEQTNTQAMDVSAMRNCVPAPVEAAINHSSLPIGSESSADISVPKDRTVGVQNESKAGSAHEFKQDNNLNGAQSALQATMTDRPELNSQTDDAPQFEADSSPYESLSDDSSDSSLDEDSDDDYPLLDPREQARILMEDGASDDEGKGDRKGKCGPLRTANEQIDETVDMPKVELTPDTAIEELGTVQVVVGDVALIRAKSSGEYQVLESNSLLCLADRKVIGVIAETIGRVDEPMYVVRFTNSTTLVELGVEVDKTIYYVPSHSHFLFTNTLKAKGSDASNLHDEEVAENEREFSDDETEAAYKSSLKKQRQARKGGRNTGATDPAMPEPDRSGQGQPSTYTNSSGPAELSYDDDVNADDLYTPLSRPLNLADIMRQGGHAEPSINSSFGDYTNRRGNFNHGGGERGRGRSRGDLKVRGWRRRSNFGDRGRGREIQDPVAEYRQQVAQQVALPPRAPLPPQQFSSSSHQTIPPASPHHFQQHSQQQPPIYPAQHQHNYGFPRVPQPSGAAQQWTPCPPVPAPQFGQLAQQQGMLHLPSGAFVNPMFFAMSQQQGPSLQAQQGQHQHPPRKHKAGGQDEW